MGAAETAVSSALSCYHLLSLLIFDIGIILVIRNSDGERGLAKWCILNRWQDFKSKSIEEECRNAKQTLEVFHPIQLFGGHADDHTLQSEYSPPIKTIFE